MRVSRDWMISILYYRGQLGKHASHPIVKKIIDDDEFCDYIVAPIADNSMYQTLNLFGRGKITDEQLSHALSATNLGYQYVFRNERSCSKLKCAERLYLCDEEKRNYLGAKAKNDEEGQKKAGLALERYRREGQFIDELFK